MTSTKPLVSVVMPVYNTEKYVAEAVQSVLAQSYQPIEVICVNDGSKDRSLKILQSFGDAITVINSPQNQGIGATRNIGVAAVHGEYIAFMDADDIWLPGKLAKQVAYMQAHPEIDILFSHMECFISPDLPEEIKRIRYCPPGAVPGYVSATSFIKKSFFDRVGAFGPQWRVGEFIDWLARAKALNAVIECGPDVLLRRRIHGTNTGVTARGSLTDYVKIVKAALDRKRKQSS